LSPAATADARKPLGLVTVTAEPPQRSGRPSRAGRS
jgi:hypothetical protein